jgi:hypothetical protein
MSGVRARMMDASGRRWTVTAMTTHELLWVLAAIVAAVAAIPVTRLAARLSVVQPVAVAVDAEADLISGVLADPSLYRSCVVVRSSDFTWAPHRAVWAQIEARSVACHDAAEIAEAEKAGVDARTINLSADELVGELRADRGVDTATLDELLERDRGRGALDAGGEVIAAAADRNTYVGASAIVDTDPQTREQPLRRLYTPPTVKRSAFAALVAAAGVGAATWAAGSTVAAAATVVVWFCALIAIAIVDHDTLYIDMRLFWAATAAAVALSMAVDGAVDRIGTAAAWGFGSAGAMWLVGAIYHRIRGVSGLGSGDLFLVVPLLAVPILLGAAPLAALWGLLAGMSIAVAVVGVAVATGARARDAAFAFGPYLATGWPFGWALFELLNR